jgi:hypothetical protein
MIHKNPAQSCTAHAILFPLQHIFEANLGLVPLSPGRFFEILWLLSRCTNATDHTPNITAMSVGIIDVTSHDLPCMANTIKSRIFFSLTALGLLMNHIHRFSGTA